MGKKVKVVMAKISEELYERVRRKSEETGVPVAFVLRRCLRAWVRSGESGQEEEE